MNLGHAKRGKALARQCIQVAQPVAGTGRRKGFRCGVIEREERGTDLVADLIRRRADAWPEPSNKIRGLRAHAADARFNHPSQQSGPACVHSANLRSIPGAQQDRNTIGGENREDGAWRSRDRRISLRLDQPLGEFSDDRIAGIPFPRLPGKVAEGRKGAIEVDDVCAMHLPQPARARGQRKRTNQQIAIRAHDGFALTAAQSEIECIERR